MICLLQPRFAGQVIDTVTSQIGTDPSPEAKAAAKHKLDGTILQIVSVVLVGAVATSLRTYLFQAASEKVVARLRRQLFASLVNQVSGSSFFGY